MDLYSLTALQEIECCDNPSVKKFIQNYLAINKPVILKNVGDNWPCLQKWNPEYFRKKIKKARVQSYDEDNLYHFNNFYKIPYTEFDKSLFSTKHLYLSATPILTEKGVIDKNNDLEPIAKDLVIPSFIDKHNIVAANLWFGPGGNKSVLHYDAWHSMLFVISGIKKFVIYEPSQTRYMYPYSVVNIKSTLQGRTMDSRINPTDVDLKKFSLVKKASGWRGTLQRSDLLFIPAGAWHFVESEDINIAVNYFWDVRWTGFLHRPLSDWLMKRVIMTPKRIFNSCKTNISRKLNLAKSKVD